MADAGTVIIITQDPDARVTPNPTEGAVFPTTPLPEPKVQVTQTVLRFNSAATPDEMALAVGTVLRQAAALREL